MDSLRLVSLCLISTLAGTSVLGVACIGRPPKRCTELAQLGVLPLPEGPLERSCEIRTNPFGKEELIGRYEIRTPQGTQVATGQFVEGKPFGRWVLYDPQGKPKGHFDYGAPALERTEASRTSDPALPAESRLSPRAPLTRAVRPTDFILPPQPSPRPGSSNGEAFQRH